jgi:hypothetical protein
MCKQHFIWRYRGKSRQSSGWITSNATEIRKGYTSNKNLEHTATKAFSAQTTAESLLNLDILNEEEFSAIKIQYCIQ